MTYLGRTITVTLGIALVVAIIAFLPMPLQILALLLTLPLGASMLTHVPVSIPRPVGTRPRLLPSSPRLIRVSGYASGPDGDMTRK